MDEIVLPELRGEVGEKCLACLSYGDSLGRQVPTPRDAPCPRCGGSGLEPILLPSERLALEVVRTVLAMRRAA